MAGNGEWSEQEKASPINIEEHDFPDTSERVADSLEEADKPIEDVEEEVDTVDEIGTLSKHELKPKVVYIYLFCLVQA